MNEEKACNRKNLEHDSAKMMDMKSVTDVSTVHVCFSMRAVLYPADAKTCTNLRADVTAIFCKDLIVNDNITENIVPENNHPEIKQQSKRKEATQFRQLCDLQNVTYIGSVGCTDHSFFPPCSICAV